MATGRDNALDMTDEELLKLVEESDEEVKYGIYDDNEVVQFIKEFQLKPGENAIPVRFIHSIFEDWWKAKENGIKPKNQVHFSRQFHLFFKKVIKDGYTWYLLNDEAFGNFDGKYIRTMTRKGAKGQPDLKTIRTLLINEDEE